MFAETGSGPHMRNHLQIKTHSKRAFFDTQGFEPTGPGSGTDMDELKSYVMSRWEEETPTYRFQLPVSMAGTANCIMIDLFSAFESGLVAPFLYAAG
jgi:hypothetical protein